MQRRFLLLVPPEEVFTSSAAAAPNESESLRPVTLTEENFVPIVDEEMADPELIHWGYDHLEDCPIYAPMHTPIPAGKFDGKNNHKRKTEFESDLAVAVLEEYRLFFPLLREINQSMIRFLNRMENSYQGSPEKIAQFQRRVGRIFQQYCYPEKPYFGRIDMKSNAPNEIATYRHIKDQILVGERRIEVLLNVHMAMAQILKNKDLNTFRTYSDSLNYYQHCLKPKELFANRGRMKDEGDGSVTTTALGIEEKPRIMRNIPKHTRALERAERDLDSPPEFVVEAYQKEIPFVAGPSGSAAECMMAAMTCLSNVGRRLSPEEKQKYVLCCFAFLGGAGSHSFHEIFTVGKNLKINYTTGRYENALPNEFRNTQNYQRLLHNYSDIIRPDSECQELFENKKPKAVPRVRLFDQQAKAIRPTNKRNIKELYDAEELKYITTPLNDSAYMPIIDLRRDRSSTASMSGSSSRTDTAMSEPLVEGDEQMDDTMLPPTKKARLG